MVHGREQHDWNRTAALLALLYNMNRGPRSRARSANDFKPDRLRVRKTVKTCSLREAAEAMKAAGVPVTVTTRK